MNAATQAWLTKDQLAAQLRDSTALLEAARTTINQLAAELEHERALRRAIPGYDAGPQQPVTP